MSTGHRCESGIQLTYLRKAGRFGSGETLHESLEQLRKDRTESAAGLANEVDDKVADEETSSLGL